MTQANNGDLRRNDLFYLDFIVFQVQNTLFKVPKNHFTASSVFATIFTLPPGENEVEGTEDKPFMLHGISEVDFESLLKLMYPPPFTNVNLTQQDWISALKLSTLWEFNNIRERAIQELLKEEMKMGTFEKIECGKSYQAKEMLLEGYTELLKRTETITAEEAKRLGWETAAKLLLLREEYITSQYSNLNRQYCARCRGSCAGSLYKVCSSGYGGYTACTIAIPTDRKQHDFTNAIQKEFEAEL